VDTGGLLCLTVCLALLLIFYGQAILDGIWDVIWGVYEGMSLTKRLFYGLLLLGLGCGIGNALLNR
jgi:hypothetical protein